MLTHSRELGIHIEELAGGRRELTLDIGMGVVRAVEIPSQAMAQDEWQLIQRAREAYARMWGGDPQDNTVEADPFDGLDQNSPYQTFHYIGQVDIPGVEPRIITMRKVSSRLTAAGEAPPPPEDAAFWLARQTKSGESLPLWNLLMTAVESPADVAALSRTGTYPYRMNGRTPIERERNAIAFAAIQILTTQEDSHVYFSLQLCQEFQTRVHCIDDILGRQVTLDFARTEDTLHLSPDWRIRLNNDHPGVQKVKTFYPGYWVDGEAAAQMMRQLLQNGALSSQELHLTLKEFPTELTTAETGHAGEIDQWIDFFTKPKYFKYLIPVIKKNEILRHKLIHNVAERPFSSTLRPRLWRQSALKLLRAAKEKYGSVTAKEQGATVSISDGSSGALSGPTRLQGNIASPAGRQTPAVRSSRPRMIR